MAVLLVALLAACQPTEPPPPADGHDIGVIANGVPNTLNAGRANHYSVQVANFGTTAATNARFAVIGPLSLSTSATTDGGDCYIDQVEAYASAVCELGDLAPGQVATIDIEAWLGDWPAPRDVFYIATADGSEPDPDPHANWATVSTSATRPAFSVPSVAITSPSPSTTVTANDTIAYAGTATDEIDGDLSDQINWSYVAAGDPEATPVALPTGASGTFGPIDEGIYVVIASVTTSSGVSAQATRVVSVGPSEADGRELGVIATSTGEVIIGGTMTDSLEVTNHGTAPATDTRVVITAPTGFNLRPWAHSADEECPGDTDDNTGLRTITCSLGTIAPNASERIDLYLNGTPGAAPVTVTYDAISDGVEPNPDPHPNGGSLPYTTRYQTPPSLDITSPGPTAEVSSATTVTYAATAANALDDDLTDQITWSYQDATDPEASPTSLPAGATGILGPLDPGTYTLTAQVDDGSGQSTTQTATVNVHAVTDNDHDLGIVVSNVADVVPLGAESTFSVSVHNYGPRRANNISLTLGSNNTLHVMIDGAYRPPGQPRENATQCFNAGAPNVCRIYALDPGATYTVIARITPDTAGTIDLNASVTADGVEPNPDPHPNTSATPITVGTPDAELPTITLSSPGTYNDGLATTDDVAVPYTATATDADGNDLSSATAWSLTQLGVPGGLTQDLGTAASGSIDPLEPGVYLLTGTVADSSGRSADAELVVTVMPADTSCTIYVVFNPVSGLYLPQIITVNATRSHDTCGRRLMFHWDAVYNATAQANAEAFNAMMNNDDHDVTRGDIRLHDPDEWIINLIVCAPAMGSIDGSCALQVSRDYAVPYYGN